MNLEDLNNKEPNTIRIMIEEGKFNHLDQIGWLNLCSLLMKKYEEKEEYGIFRLIQKETLVHTSEIRNDDHKLIPISDLEFNFKAEDLNYFASKVSTTRNLLLKAKFADIVWQESEEKNTAYASKAAEGYMEMVDFFFGKENFNYLVEILVHSLDLSIVSGDQKLLEICVKILEETIKNFINTSNIRWNYDLLNAIIENYEKVKKLIDKNKLMEFIENGEEYYNERDFYWKNKFLERARKIP